MVPTAVHCPSPCTLPLSRVEQPAFAHTRVPRTWKAQVSVNAQCSRRDQFRRLSQNENGVLGVREWRGSHKGTQRLSSSSSKFEAVRANAGDEDTCPPGCSRVKVELSRPLGLVFEERKSGGIFVAEVPPQGRAAQTGLVGIGDELIATSAVVYTDSDNYGGVEVRKGMQIVRITTRGESFDAIMAAIGTHPAYMKVTLELQKCLPEE